MSLSELSGKRSPTGARRRRRKPSGGLRDLLDPTGSTVSSYDPTSSLGKRYEVKVLSAYTPPTAKVLPGTGGRTAGPADVPSRSMGMTPWGEGESSMRSVWPPWQYCTLRFNIAVGLELRPLNLAWIGTQRLFVSKRLANKVMACGLSLIEDLNGNASIGDTERGTYSSPFPARRVYRAGRGGEDMFVSVWYQQACQSSRVKGKWGEWRWPSECLTADTQCRRYWVRTWATDKV